MKLATKSGRTQFAPTVCIVSVRRGDLRSPVLCCCVQHVFDEDAIAGGGVVDQDMGHGADELAVLDDGTAGHADVK